PELQSGGSVVKQLPRIMRSSPHDAKTIGRTGFSRLVQCPTAPFSARAADLAMLDHDSIAAWLLGARAGESAAAQEIWQRYFARLARLAREKLPSHAKRAFDEEDVAHSALRCFLYGIAQDRYPQLSDRHGLW